MIYPQSDNCILDWMFISKKGTLERWQVFVVSDTYMEQYYQVFINGSLTTELAVDADGRWVDLDTGYSIQTDETGEMIETYAR